MPAAAARVVLKGTLLDPPEKLFVALGLAPDRPLPAGAEERIERRLDALGYEVQVQRQPGRTVLRLTPHRLIRKIYIKGNWPIFEDEILRRLRFRPGQRLPAGEDLELAIKRQEERFRRFLNREGYFEGRLRIKVQPTKVPHQVKLEVRVEKGRRYKVGQVKVVQVGAAVGPRSGDRKRPAELALSRDKIDKMFQQKILFYQRAFSTERFKEDVKALVERFHKLGYPGVRVRESYRVDKQRPPSEAVRVTLRIQQRKKIVLEFTGNNHLDRDDLRAAVTIFEEGTYDDYELQQTAQALRRLYQSKGYLQARVHFNRQVGAQQDRVRFEIHEGPRFRVREILFTGNRAVSTEDLRKVIRTRTFPWLGYIGLGEGGYITDVQLKQDVERVKQLYRSRGFPDVRVRGELAPHPDLLGQAGALAAAMAGGVAQEGDLYVRFTIYENKRLMVEQVLLHGNRAIPQAVLQEKLALKPGRPFDDKQLTLDKARLVRIYSERGYPYATVRSLEELSPDGSKVTIQLSVREGRQVRFGPVFIRGNFKTRQRVILQDIQFEQGAPFDIREIEGAERRLRAREIFNVVRIQPLGISERAEVVPVVVTLEERYDNWGELELAVGGSTDFGLFGSVAYRNRNLLGFATQLSVKGELGMELWGADIHYRDDRLFGSVIMLDLKGFVRNVDTERLGEIFTAGGAVSLSRELTELTRGLTVIGRYDIRQRRHPEQIVRPAGVDETGSVDVTPRTAGLGLTLVFDRRDSQIAPSEGFKIGASVFGASRYLGGNADFIKFNVNAQYYQPLPKGMTIALNVRYDQGLPLAGAETLPKVERYYAGGDTTIRGLEEDHAWVEQILVPVGPLGGATLLLQRPKGGNIRLLGNLEFQFPIWDKSIIFGFPIKGAVFLDNGVVTNSWSAVSASDFRHSAGAALRLFTPVGFTSFEYAIPLDLQPGDPRTLGIPGRFHFNFGYIF